MPLGYFLKFQLEAPVHSAPTELERLTELPTINISLLRSSESNCHSAQTTMRPRRAALLPYHRAWQQSSRLAVLPNRFAIHEYELNAL